MNNDSEPCVDGLTPRQHWMRVLARADGQLHAYEMSLRQAKHRFIRPPEVGMMMVRGRIGGSGSPFNLGEMTVTRCVVQLGDSRTGYSYVAGRNKAHAELAALADALLQGDEYEYWMSTLIQPLAQKQSATAALRAAQVGATKVDFLTMVRGD